MQEAASTHLDELRLFGICNPLPVFVGGLLRVVIQLSEEGHVELVVAHGVDDRHLCPVDAFQQTLALLTKNNRESRSREDNFYLGTFPLL